MKASFSERLRFSYTYALLQDAADSVRQIIGVQRRKGAATPVAKAAARGAATQGSLRSAHSR